MAAIAIERILSLLTNAQIGIAGFFGTEAFGRQGGTTVRAFAERLIGRATTGTPVILMIFLQRQRHRL
jgi:hypothetical protein